MFKEFKDMEYIQMPIEIYKKFMTFIPEEEEEEGKCKKQKKEQ